MERDENEDYILTRHWKKIKRDKRSFNEVNAEESFK